MKTALTASMIAAGVLLSGCGGGNSVSQIVEDHYDALSDADRTALCDLWNGGTESKDNIVELEMSRAPGWDGGDSLIDENEEELGNAIADWFEGSC